MVGWSEMLNPILHTRLIQARRRGLPMRSMRRVRGPNVGGAADPAEATARDRYRLSQRVGAVERRDAAAVQDHVLRGIGPAHEWISYDGVSCAVSAGQLRE